MARKTLDEQIDILQKEIAEKQDKLASLKKRKQQEEEKRLNESGIRIAKLLKSKGIVDEKKIESLINEINNRN